MVEMPIREFEFIGGNASLDFTNTFDGSRKSTGKENLESCADLVEWSRQAGFIDQEELERLMQIAEEQPGLAQEVFERAIVLRESIFWIFSHLAGGEPQVSSDLEKLNRELSLGMGRLRVEPSAEGFRWGWAREPFSLDLLLGPIAHSAADLLTSSDLQRVRECGGIDCSWLFVDRTKNHSRVWCEMEGCGNRSKVRRYRRKKAVTENGE